MDRVNTKSVSTILVTDAECASALSCIRMLGQAGHKVYAIGSDTLAASAGSRYLERCYKKTSAWRDGEGFVRQVATICKELQPHYVLPVSDASVYYLMQEQKSISEGVKILTPSRDLSILGSSKIETFLSAKRQGIPIASGCVLQPGEPALLPISYPLIARTDNHINEDGVFCKGQAWVVKSSLELKQVRRECDRTQQSLLVQKYIDGYGAGCFLLLEKGKTLCWHTHERLAEIPWYGGVSARRRLTFNRELLALSQKLLRDLDATGIAMVEFRFPHNPLNAEPLLVEVNARPWGSMAIAVHAGIPFLRKWIEQRENKQSEPQVNNESEQLSIDGLVCTSIIPGEVGHLRSIFHSTLKRELSWQTCAKALSDSLLCVLSPRTRFDYFHYNDPTPALYMLLNTATTIVTRTMKLISNKFEIALLSVTHWMSSKRRLLNSNKSLTERQYLLIVCQGNRCRSPFLEMAIKAALGEDSICVFSRGLCVDHPTIPLRFFPTFEMFDFSPSKHRAQPLTRSDLKKAHRVIVMETKHATELRRRFGWKHYFKCELPRQKSGPFLEIHDPFTRSPVDAAKIFEQLNQCAYAELENHSRLRQISGSPKVD
jgi:protein-tyrosine-phosphatase/predicted ATP-grasp superfamily ATP-dependent carboligase